MSNSLSGMGHRIPLIQEQKQSRMILYMYLFDVCCCCSSELRELFLNFVQFDKTLHPAYYSIRNCYTQQCFYDSLDVSLASLATNLLKIFIDCESLVTEKTPVIARFRFVWGVSTKTVCARIGCK